MTEAQIFIAAGIAAPHPSAAAAGRDVLIEGGTIVEAALAAAMVSAVAVPERNGLGGDALWLLREAGPRGRVRVLDARGTTGARAGPARLRDLGHDAVPDRGPDAVLTAPATGAGWAEVHAFAAALGGRLPLRRLLEPAIAAARDGVAPLALGAPALAAAAERAESPGFATRFPADGRQPAGPWRFPELAATLDHLASAGLDDLTRGDVGRELARDIAGAGGPLTRDDLRAALPRWRPSATLDLGRATVDVAPFGSGIAAAAALGLVAGLGGMGARDSVESVHGLIEALALGPHLVAEATREIGGAAALLDRDRLRRAAERIDRRRARPLSSPTLIFPETGVVVSAVDRDGAAVALVQTLGSAWGSGVVSERTGILLGNRAAALTLDSADPRGLMPGRRVPLRAVPMLLSDRAGRVASLAAAGPHGSALSGQVAARLLAQQAEAAFAAPRLAFGPAPDGTPAVLVEPDREPEPAGRLRAAGHALVPASVGALRTLTLVERQPTGRIAALGDDGDAAMAGL